MNATHLRIAGVEEIISRTSLTAGLFAATLVNQGITSVVSDLLTHKEGAYLRKIRIPEEFVGKTQVQQHRRVYQPLGGRMESQEIHALALKTYTPDAWASQRA